MARLPRHSGNAPPLASRAREEEVDVPHERPPGPATDRCRDPSAHLPTRPGEPALGLRPYRGRAQEAWAARERDDDTDPAPDGTARSCPAALWPDLDRVPPRPGRWHRRLRLLHRRDRLAPDAGRPRVHRARSPADPPQPLVKSQLVCN